MKPQAKYTRYKLNVKLKNLYNKRGLSNEELQFWTFECEFCFQKFDGIKSLKHHQANGDQMCLSSRQFLTHYHQNISGIKLFVHVRIIAHQIQLILRFIQ